MSLLAKIASLRQVNINAHAEIETLKLCVADRDEHADALKDEIKSLRHFFSAPPSRFRWEGALKDEINTLSLSLADRDEEVKSLKEDLDEFDWRGGSLKVEIDCLTQCLGERDEEIKTLKDVLANYATAKVVRGMGVVFQRKKVAETEE